MSTRLLATLVGLSIAGCSCAQDQAGGQETHAANTGGLVRPPEKPKPPQPKATAFDQVRELAAIAGAVEGGRKVRVIVQLQGLQQESVAGLSPAGLKARREKMKSLQSAILTALGHAADAKDVVRIDGLPYVGFEFGAAELDALRGLQSQPGVFAFNAGGSPVTLRVERTQPMRAQECAEPPAVGTPLAAILDRIEATPMTAIGTDRIVVVIDSAVQADALQMAAHLIEAPASIRGSTVALIAAAAGGAVTHGTKVACVLANAAPGCRILAWNMRADDGAIQPDLVASVLSKLYFAEEPGFQAQLTAVCMSLAYQNVKVYDACTDPLLDSPMNAAFRETIHNLATRKVGVIVPAGNSDVLGCGYTLAPWCMTEAICVGATDSASVAAAGFTNWSPLVDLAAPGTAVEVPIRAGYPSSLSGTSIAVPFVGAALARLAEAHPDSTLEQRLAELKKGEGATGCDLTVAEIRIASASAGLAALGAPTPTPTPPIPTPTPPAPGPGSPH